MTGVVLAAVFLSGLADFIIAWFMFSDLLGTPPSGSDRGRRLKATIAALSFLLNGAVLLYHSIDLLRSIL